MQIYTVTAQNILPQISSQTNQQWKTKFYDCETLLLICAFLNNFCGGAAYGISFLFEFVSS